MNSCPMIDESLKIKINILAEKVGVTLNWERNPKDSVQWNGYDIACWNQNASNIIHDIAHYTVASNSRRKLPDFGLGTGPDSIDDSPREMSIEKCDDEETKASALGIYWEKQLKMDWKSTARYHAWTEPYHLDLKKAWISLEKSNAEYMSLV